MGFSPLEEVLLKYGSGFIKRIRIEEQTEALPVLPGALSQHLEGSGRVRASSGPSFAHFLKNSAKSTTAKTCVWKILHGFTLTQKAQVSVQNQRAAQNFVFTTMLEMVWCCSKVEKKHTWKLQKLPPGGMSPRGWP